MIGRTGQALLFGLYPPNKSSDKHRGQTGFSSHKNAVKKALLALGPMAVKGVKQGLAATNKKTLSTLINDVLNGAR